MIPRALGFILKKAGYEQVGVLLGYLRISGWMKSLSSKNAVDANGNPLPWYSYPAIHFLRDRLNGLREKQMDLRIFEFGSGNSTLWWAPRAFSVVSVEDNRQWHSYVSQNKPSNVVFKFASDEKSYLDALLLEDGLFDVIVVDGSYRGECITRCCSKLKASGVLIVDDSDWDCLASSLLFVESLGFRRLELYGLGPIVGHPCGTSILYRPDNLFGI